MNRVANGRGSVYRNNVAAFNCKGLGMAVIVQYLWRSEIVCIESCEQNSVRIEAGFHSYIRVYFDVSTHIQHMVLRRRRIAAGRP